MRRCLLSCVLTVGVLAASAPPAAADPSPAWPAGAAPGRLVVVTEDRLAAAAVTAAPARATQAKSVADRVLTVTVPAGSEAAQAAALRARPGVRSVEPDWLLRAHASPDDPRFAEQWAHQRTDAPGAWDLRTDASAARVAVIDTGVNALHPDLGAHITEQVDLSTGVPAGPPRAGIDNDTCQKGHGTQVAGVIAAAGDNGRDLAGVAWRADVLDIAVASTAPGADCVNIPMSAIVAGIDYAVRGTSRPASVVSISMGGYGGGCPSAMQAAVDQAWSAGTIVVASAGNGERDPLTAGKYAYPASCDKVVSVAATGPTDARALYSQTNDAVDIAAPGGDTSISSAAAVLTTHRDLARPVIGVQGTSFAAPYVSGALALLRAERAGLSPATVLDLLASTAKDLGLPGRDREYGEGLIQLRAMLSAADGTAQPAPVVSDPVGGGAAEPEPEPDPEPDPAPDVARVSGGGGTTEAVAQAVAVSRLAFARKGAAHAVLARGDDFADALAGSALGMGAGPLLFAPREGPLPEATRIELARALPDGAVVYLLGGEAALSAGLDDELAAMGLRPVRLAGGSREETAAVVAREVLRRAGELGKPDSGRVLLATRGDWPDAVSGGGLAALLAAPVLLTAPDALHPATARALEELQPGRVLVVGGTAAVSEVVAQEAGAAAGARVQRLSGPARDATAVAVAQEAHRLLGVRDQAPRYAVAVNLRRADAFAHALSASVLSGATGALLVPVERDAGTELTQAARDWAGEALHDPATDVLLAGEVDIVADQVGEELGRLLVSARAAQQS